MNSEYGTASLRPWRASNCLTTVSTTRPITSQMPIFLSRLFNVAPRDAFVRGPPPSFPIRCDGSYLDAPTVRFYPFSGSAASFVPAGCLDLTTFVRNTATHSAFETLADQVDLAAPVPRRLGLPYVNLREMRFQRTPELDESFALERFDDEIASGLQPAPWQIRAQAHQGARHGPDRRPPRPDRLGDRSETTRSTLPSPSAFSSAASPASSRKSACTRVAPETGCHRQQVDGDDRGFGAETLAQHLRPAPGRGAQVDDAHPRPEQMVALGELDQLERGARAVAQARGFLDPRVVDVLRSSTP